MAILKQLPQSVVNGPDPVGVVKIAENYAE